MFGLFLKTLPATLASLLGTQSIALNEALEVLNLPSLYPSSEYARHYSMRATPQFKFTWRGLKLNRIYLRFQVNEKEDPTLFGYILGHVKGAKQSMHVNNAGIKQIDLRVPDIQL